MTMTAVEIGHARPARSPDTRAAIKYLEASGATAITITEHDGVCAFRVGSKIDPRAVAIFWIMEADAKPVVARARKRAGKSQDIAAAEVAQPVARLARRHAGRDRADPETMLAALRQAAADLHVTLTPHAVAMERAGEAAAKLNRFMDSLRGTGVLKEFTKAYRRKRLAAGLRGEGFMSYANAELRLRRALIPLLMGGGQPAVGQSLFARVFGGKLMGSRIYRRWKSAHGLPKRLFWADKLSVSI